MFRMPETIVIRNSETELNELTSPARNRTKSFAIKQDPVEA